MYRFRLAQAVTRLVMESHVPHASERRELQVLFRNPGAGEEVSNPCDEQQPAIKYFNRIFITTSSRAHINFYRYNIELV